MQEVALNNGNTAIGTSATTVAQAFNVSGDDPLVLAVGFIPQCTGVTTLNTVTATLIRTDTSAVIGSATSTNGAAGTQPVGPVVVIAVVPPGIPANQGVALQIVGSATAGNAVGTATAPCVLAVFGLS